MISSARRQRPVLEALEPRQLLANSPLGTSVASFNNWFVGGIALSPVEPVLYVSDLTADKIYKLDTRTLTVIGQGATVNEPLRMVVSRDGSELYVGSRAVSGIQVLNPTTLQQIRTISTTDPCGDLALGTGNLLFASANGLPGGYYRINTTTGAYEHLLPYNAVGALAATPDGSRLIGSSSYSPDTVWLFDGVDPYPIKGYNTPYSYLARIAVSHNGRQVIAPTETSYGHWLLRSSDLYPIRPLAISGSSSAFSPDDQYIYEVSPGQIRKASALTGNVVQTANASVPSVYYTPLVETDRTGRYIFVGIDGEPGGLQVYATGASLAKAADARAIPNLVTEFDASDSFSSAGNITKYEWDLNNDGVFTDSTGAKPRVLWSKLNALGITTPGQTFDIRVRVTTDTGQVSTSAAAKLTVTTAVGIPITSASSSALTYGTPVTINVRVPGSGAVATGSVQIFMDGVARGTATLNAEGKASFVFGRPVTGEHRFYAVYSGDSKYSANTGPATYIQVAKAPTTLTLEQVGVQANNCLQLKVTVSFGAAPPAGEVEFFAGTRSLGRALVGSGTIDLLLPPLVGGPWTITARFDGDANRLPGSTQYLTTLAPLATATDLSVSIGGNTAQMTASVGSALNNVPGQVQFFNKGVLLGSASLVQGTAAFSLTGLDVGLHQFSARYVGSAEFATSTSNTLSTYLPGITIASSQSSITYGEPVTITVSVIGSGTKPTGSVQIFMDGVARGTATLNAEGKASFLFGRPVAGEHRFYAVYSGDSRYLANTGPATYVQVAKAPATLTLQQVGEVEANNRLRLKATVSFGAAPLAGELEFLAGTRSLGKAPVGSGTIEVLLPTIAGGTQTITVRHAGDANRKPGSASLQIKLPPLYTATDLTVTSQGDTAQLRATVRSYVEGVTGTVQFHNNGIPVGTAAVLAGGLASLDITGMPAGPQQFSAVFVASEQFAGSTSNLWTGTLQAPTNLTVAGSASESRRSDPFTVTVAIGTASRTALLPTGIVEFREDNVVLGSAQVSNGLATFTTTTLSPGFHYITAHYSGDAYFMGAVSSPLSHHVIYDNVIDVLVAYTQSANIGGNVENAIYAAIADANDAMISSRVEASIELVYAYQTDYVESGDMDRDLTRFVTPGDGYMDDAQKFRNQYGADVAVLWLGDSDMGGLAYVLRDFNDDRNNDHAYLALMGDQAGQPYYTFAHELGHILGAAHDRENSDGGGLYSYSYGYRFMAGGAQYHDIMSYDPGTTIPYYANPEVYYQGVPTGNSGSNVAATFVRSVPVVSRYRSTKVPSSTPVNVTLSSSRPTGSNYDSFTLTARLTPTLASAQTPKGIVTFYDGATELGTASVAANAAIWTGKIKRAGSHSLRAVYVADDFFGGGVSSDLTVTTFESKVLPGGALRITGTPGDDSIAVTDTGTGVQVTVNNDTRSFAEPSSIWIDGGDGNDMAVLGDNIPTGTLLGGNGDDRLFSGNGADQLSGNAGNDSIEAGLGNDTAFGGQGNDTIYGGDGNDRLAGAGGDDQLYGLGGNDTLVGDAGRDTLMGATGDDLLASYDLAADILKGGDGRDIGYFDLKLDIRQDVFELVKGDTPYVLA